MRFHHWRYGIVLGCVCGVAALTGYGMAGRVPHAGVTAGGAAIPARDGPAPAGTTPDKERPSSSGERQLRRPEQLAALKADLQRKLSESPNPWVDSVLRSQVAAVLGNLTADELATYHGEVDVSAEATAFFHTWQSTLAREILRQWGLKDPAAASLAEAAAKNFPRAYVFDDWMRRASAAAEKWVMEGDSASDPAKARILHTLLIRRAKEDPAGAEAILARLPDTDRELAFRNWSRAVAHDPAGLSKLLSMIDVRGDEALREKCYGDVISAMATKSPESAGNFLESTTLSEDAKDRMMERLIRSWAQKSPEEAFRWWAALKEPTARPGMVEAMKQWYHKEREAPIHMIRSLEHGAARSTFESEAIGLYTSVHDFECATRIAGAIRDDEARIRQMRIIKRSWDERSKSAAAAWLATLPGKDRAAVE